MSFLESWGALTPCPSASDAYNQNNYKPYSKVYKLLKWTLKYTCSIEG